MKQWQVHPKVASKCLKFLPLNFIPWAYADECADEFLVTVIEGVVYGVYKVGDLVVFWCNTAI